MSAIVTDQFRILNAENFVQSIQNDSNSYYVFLSLSNPGGVNNTGGIGYGRTDLAEWNSYPFNPADNNDYLPHSRDTILFGKKVTSSNIRRVVRKINWVKGERYEMYRHDYSISNRSPISDRSRLYDTNYYVINSEYRVYICIDNGSNGSSAANLKGNRSQDEPIFTDLEPSRAGESGDGYIWKYLFSISPSDIVKFDSIEYIVLPNDWATTIDPQITAVRENGDSESNNNQIKKVYISNPGKFYSSGEVDILGDGVGGRVYIETNTSGEITNTTVTNGGSGYTYGIVNLEPLRLSGTTVQYPATLIPIIPPSKGHGYDIYKELGADKVLIYSRFDDSSKDFPTDTKFAQIGILKNPLKYSSEEVFKDSEFSGLYAMKFPQTSSINLNQDDIGDVISQSVSGQTVYGYVSSWDSETKVLKYYKDRSLYFGDRTTQKDYYGVSTQANSTINFNPSSGSVSYTDGNIVGILGAIDSSFSGITTQINNKIYNLGVEFQSGVAYPEINKKTGEIIYLDNRPLVLRNSRQKEDIKIILEF